jgi:hypothetical protein
MAGKGFGKRLDSALLQREAKSGFFLCGGAEVRLAGNEIALYGGLRAALCLLP